VDSLEEYRRDVRERLAAHMPVRPAEWRLHGPRSDEAVARARRLQHTLAVNGLAGITWPVEYGGQGLTPAHERIVQEELAGYELPRFFGSTLEKIARALLVHGSAQHKRDHLPRMLHGEELWAQFLSEPGSGSDLAGATTRAERDGDTWVLNGSKIWTTSGHYADFALCLARTNWDVPKHKGLSVFIVPVRTPGLTVVPIRLAVGTSEFCQEFLDDVRIPLENLVGTVDDGWTVARTLLVYERNAFAGGAVEQAQRQRRDLDAALLELARAAGTAEDPRVRDLIVQAHVTDMVNGQLAERIISGQAAGKITGPAGSLIKLSTAAASHRTSDIALEIAGPGAVASRDAVPQIGTDYIGRQALAVGGGTNEMQRNTIGERLLGLPREPQDNSVPFRLVKTNPVQSLGGRRD
jgi:alkylation response protein AidB-like acyl-CoA dehydrogenase